jgi:hypothetical protein
VMLPHVALVTTNISDECITSIIKVKYLRSMLWLLVTANAPSSLVLTRATQHNIPEALFQLNYICDRFVIP